MKKILTVFMLAIHAGTPALSQNVGINTTSPAAQLDVNSDLALRIGNIILPGTTNADVNTTADKKSVYRITGGSPLGYSISGFTGGVDGRFITIINASTSQMALKRFLLTGASPIVFSGK